MSKIHITNLNNIRIYKIKNWAVYFENDGQKYLLHQDSDYNCTYLYKKDVDNNGKYTLEDLKFLRLPIRMFAPRKKPGQTYKSIKAEFVFRLTYFDVADGIFEEIANKKKKVKEIHNKKIKDMMDEILDMKAFDDNFNLEENCKVISQMFSNDEI